MEWLKKENELEERVLRLEQENAHFQDCCLKFTVNLLLTL
jgi:hypothetical protein